MTAPLLAPSLPAPVIDGPILAIESSCDDTACAIMTPDGTVLAEAVVTQSDHAALGGVVPEIAARAHLDILPTLLTTTLNRAGLALRDIHAYAASTGPGLIGGLIVGSTFAKGLAIAQQRPFIAANHIEAHALSPRLPGTAQAPLAFPYLLMLMSGGHCQCVAVRGIGDYDKLGGTIDDAAGEAFDKTAKLLGLGWPGGPAVEQIAEEGNPRAIDLPRPLFGRDGCDFSFSGLKTAVARQVASHGNSALPRQYAADIAASFQRRVADIIADRAGNALDMLPDATAIVVAGGVAANKALRRELETLATARGLPFLAPPLKLCTDNAVMVGWAAIERLRAGQQIGAPLRDDIPTAPRPRWPLSDMHLNTAAEGPS